MTGTFTPPSAIPLLFWMWTAELTSKVLTTNGWQVKFHPFWKDFSNSPLDSQSFHGVSGQNCPEYNSAQILPFDTTLMTSRVQVPFERTHRESCAFDVGILDTGLVHVLHPE